MPLLTSILAGVAAASGAVGVGESIAHGGAQQDAINSQLDIAKQEEARKQDIFKQLQPFFSTYLKSGSPFLSQQQTASSQQVQKQYGDKAGQFRNQMQTNGLGFGPSGTTAAGLGGIATEAAGTGASDYLTNLLNNEQVKFQAAQGISGLANGPQISPQPAQYPVNPTPGAVGSFATQLQNLLKTLNPSGGPSGSPVTPGGPNIPAFSPGQTLPNLGIGLPGPAPTQGVSGGWDGSE